MCALITDGRFSGGTSGLSIGHVSPEAASGGTIALVAGRRHDRRSTSRTAPSQLDVADAELDDRRARLEADERLPAGEPRPRKVSTALQAYAAMAMSADKGAVRDVSRSRPCRTRKAHAEPDVVAGRGIRHDAIEVRRIRARPDVVGLRTVVVAARSRPVRRRRHQAATTLGHRPAHEPGQADVVGPRPGRGAQGALPQAPELGRQTPQGGRCPRRVAEAWPGVVRPGDNVWCLSGPVPARWEAPGAAGGLDSVARSRCLGDRASDPAVPHPSAPALRLRRIRPSTASGARLADGYLEAGMTHLILTAEPGTRAGRAAVRLARRQGA